jgi:hypothetical protein
MSSPDRVNTTNTAMIQALVVGTVRVDGVVMVVPIVLRRARCCAFWCVSVLVLLLSNRFDCSFRLR